MLGKIIKPESRGTLIGAASLVGSIGILITNGLGGYLYDNVDHKWPFILIIILYFLFTVVLVVLGSFDMLKV
jgi:MFS family permease